MALTSPATDHKISNSGDLTTINDALLQVKTGEKRIKIEPQSQASIPSSTSTVIDYRQAQQHLLQLERVRKAKSKPSPLRLTSQAELDEKSVQLRLSDSYENTSAKISSNSINQNDVPRPVLENDGSNNWMTQQDFSREKEDNELESLKRKQAVLIGRKANLEENFGLREELKLDKLTKNIIDLTRRNKLALRLLLQEDEDLLFVSDHNEDSEEEIASEAECRLDKHDAFRENKSDMAMDLDFKQDDLSLTGVHKPKPRKGQSVKAVVAAREREKQLARNREQKKKSRPKSGKQTQCRAKARSTVANNGKKRSAAKKRKAVPTLHKNRMINLPGKKGDSLEGLLANLLTNDPIRDRLDQADYGDAPIINEKTKNGQFRALMASVGTSYDVRRGHADHSSLLAATKRFGRGRVTARNGKWVLKGMKSPLYHHQVLAADWMITRELSDLRPHGGLLADAMGMGKTVEMLATMVGHPPDQQEIRKSLKSTLIVLPSSAIEQWMDEIRAHTTEEVFPNVLHYKRSKELPLSMLKTADIVLCSYAEVMRSYEFPPDGDRNVFDKSVPRNSRIESAAKDQGTLHQMVWYRIFLDEAQAIKNNSSRTSKACQALKGRFRWAISGTPIQNRLDELFPYFRFLQTGWTSDFNDFRQHYCNPEADDAIARIAVTLSIIMMRRTMKDKIFNRPIVELPPTHPETKVVKFSSAEKALYRILEDRFRDMLNEHFVAGTAERNYAVFLVQLLRLRQCTAHPFLLEKTIKDIFTAHDVKRLKSAVSKQAKQSRPMYMQIEQWVEQSAMEKATIVAEGGNLTEAVPFGRNERFGKLFHLNDYLKTLDDRQLRLQVECEICADVLKDPQRAECGCVFCRTCIESHIHTKRLELESSGDEFMACPSCQRIFNGIVAYEGIVGDEDELDDDDAEDDQVGFDELVSNHSSGPEPKIASKDQDWFKMAQRTNNLLPSSKLLAVKAQILKWLDAAPGDKIIVFTQWTMMVRMVGMICEQEHWGYICFTGDMKGHMRHEAVRSFHDDPNIRIMIASLKCGGQALNLTCANRVISIDLWWNHSVEQQAFGRVFRIGQHKETYVSRIVVRNTIDMRMLDLQADKVKIIDQAMQDNGEAVQPLPLSELASLFGHLRQDVDGTMIVEPDYSTDGEDEEDKVAVEST